MTPDELRAKYTVAYRIADRELRMRKHVFKPGHPKRDEKLREMERLMEILTEFKDELKQHIGNNYEQPTLLDVPRKAEYN